MMRTTKNSSKSKIKGGADRSISYGGQNLGVPKERNEESETWIDDELTEDEDRKKDHPEELSGRKRLFR